MLIFHELAPSPNNTKVRMALRFKQIPFEVKPVAGRERAAVLLVEAATADRLGLTPLAYVGPSAAAGVDPAHMGIGPVFATRPLLARAGLDAADLDVIELNEAFAAQSLPCIRELQLDPEKVNPEGGAIAIGHPLGATGARMVVTMVHEMRRTNARRGLATLCVGVGQGLAAIIEGANE